MQGDCQAALTMCNATSIGYAKKQIPIPPSTGLLRTAVSQPHRADGPELGPLFACYHIHASQSSHPTCQPPQFQSSELLMMLYCNTLCISNHLFLQFWVSSAVTQGRDEDFSHTSTELEEEAFEEEILGNKLGAGWVSQKVQV